MMFEKVAICILDWVTSFNQISKLFLVQFIVYSTNVYQILIFDNYSLVSDNINTDSTKINRPEHTIRMYCTNFRQPTAHV